MKEISARTTVISEVGKGCQIYEEPGHHGSSAKSLLALLSTGSSFQVDLDAYVNDLDSRQPSKKALCADQMSLVTTAHSSSFSASPKRVSIYNNKQTAILSPEKGGMALPHFHGTNKPKSHPTSWMTPTSVEFRTALDKALGCQEAQWEAKNTARKKMMAPYDKLMDEVDQDDTAKEMACLARIQILREKFAKDSREKGSGKQADESNKYAEIDYDEGVRKADSNEDDKDFSYHSSDSSAEEDGNHQDNFGQHAVGTSPMVTEYGHNTNHEDALPNWLDKANPIRAFAKPEFLSAPINQIFPCIACLNHKNINNPSTRVLVFLRKSGNTSWEVFDEDFDDLGYGFEWDGDEGLENLWGLYF